MYEYQEAIMLWSHPPEHYNVDSQDY